jgi:hypothetical protein
VHALQNTGPPVDGYSVVLYIRIMECVAQVQTTPFHTPDPATASDEIENSGPTPF